MKKIIPKFIGAILNILTPVFPKYTRNKAFNLLCKVKRLPISEEGQMFFNDGETHWLEVAGYRTALHKWGNGPKTIFFMHGWMSHSQRWRTYVETLDKDIYTCYALDAPGHGSSEGNFLNLEIYREAYEKALEITGPVEVLVSHSLGNLVAGYHYLYKPSVPVESYIVMGSPSGMDAIFTYFVDIMGLSKAMIRNLGIRINEVLKLPHDQVSMKEFFSNVNKPIFVIHEEKDPITPVKPIRDAISRAADAKELYTTGHDHTLKSPLVLEAVVNFISERTKKNTHVLERI